MTSNIFYFSGLSTKTNDEQQHVQYERNYHIFYCMLAGLDKEHKERLHLKEASHYKYLVGGGVTTCEGRDDAEEFAEIRSAMKVLEMTDQDIWDGET